MRSKAQILIFYQYFWHLVCLYRSAQCIFSIYIILYIPIQKLKFCSLCLHDYIAVQLKHWPMSALVSAHAPKNINRRTCVSNSWRRWRRQNHEKVHCGATADAAADAAFRTKRLRFGARRSWKNQPRRLAGRQQWNHFHCHGWQTQVKYLVPKNLFVDTQIYNFWNIGQVHGQSSGRTAAGNHHEKQCNCPEAQLWWDTQ